MMQVEVEDENQMVSIWVMGVQDDRNRLERGQNKQNESEEGYMRRSTFRPQKSDVQM